MPQFSSARRSAPDAEVFERAGSEDSVARQVIAQADDLLAGDGSVRRNFASLLFTRAMAEDILRYTAQDLAAIAARAEELLIQRAPGAAKIRFETVPLAAAEGRKSLGVIEILNDDMPFLVDSVLADLNEAGMTIRLIVHPVLAVERDAAGRMTAWHAEPTGRGGRESFIHIHVDPVEDAARRREIVDRLATVLTQVRVAVQDWRPMIARIGDIIAELKDNPPPLAVDEIAEAIQFLDWLRADNFTFLGIRDYTFDGSELKPHHENSLGVLRAPEMRVLRRGTELLEFTPEILAFLKEPKPLIVAKANVRSLVHRRVYLDYVGVKRFSQSGQLIGEYRIVGLFTSSAYTRPARTIPYLRRKLAAVERRAGFDSKGHSGKALANVLEQYPRDELFQIEEDTLYHFALAILQLDEHPRIRVLARRDRFDRFVSVLVFVPRERYDSHTRIAIGDYLAEAFKGHVSAFYPFFPEGPLTRVHFIIGRASGTTPQVDRATLEHAVAGIVRTWSDAFADALSDVSGNTGALLPRYRDAFSVGYREAYAPAAAVNDLRILEALSDERPLGIDFHRRQEEDRHTVGLKVWSRQRPLPLSERVPVLENMGFRVIDERTFLIEPAGAGAAPVWLHDMLLRRADGEEIDLAAAKTRLEAAFLMVMRGGAENDGYNALVLDGGLMWREVALIRTVSRFLRQIRVPYSQDYMWTTLVKHAAIAADIVALFHARFDLTQGDDDRPAREREVAARIEDKLNGVASLDEDRILRHMLNAVQSAIRTNFYQLDKDGRPKAQIAI
jgi:glutamate dehydrogenase